MTKQSEQYDQGLLDQMMNDESIRAEFGKLFSWYENDGYYGEQRKPKTPTWFEIFAEVGRIMERGENKAPVVSHVPFNLSTAGKEN